MGEQYTLLRTKPTLYLSLADIVEKQQKCLLQD